MVYDILKMIKKSLKYWYVFITTLILSLVVFVIEFDIWDSSRIVVNYILVVICIIVVEFFILGTILTNKEIIMFDGELQELFEAKILITNYNESIQKLNNELIKLKNETLILAKDDDMIKQLINTHGLYYFDINKKLVLKDLNCEFKSVIIEVIKDQTAIPTIIEIIEELRSNDIKDIYFITRNKERTREDPFNK